MDFDINSHTILRVIHGSHAYGLARPDSDIDIRGIAIPPAKYFHGFFFGFQHYTGDKEMYPEEEKDIAIYEIRKFFFLASECNPSILDILWVPERCIQKNTRWGEKLILNRGLFLSLKARHTFYGYAIEQLRRIETHRGWLLHPPDHEPTMEEFGLASLRPQQIAQIERLTQSIEDSQQPEEENRVTLEEFLPSNIIAALNRVREYLKKRKEWRQFQHWKATRNPERSALEERFGYDTKHAMHLVRPAQMCRDILTTGQIIVERTGADREELISVRNGEWTYEGLVEWLERKNVELTDLYEKCTILPHDPDREKLDALCVEIVEDFLGIEFTGDVHMISEETDEELKDTEEVSE